MQGHHGVISFDHSFKIMKFISVNGKRAFAGCLTFFSAIGTVLGIYLTQSKSLAEVKKELRMMRARFTRLGPAHGGGPPKLVFSDQPSIDEPFMLKIWPSLKAAISASDIDDGDAVVTDFDVTDGMDVDNNDANMELEVGSI